MAYSAVSMPSKKEFKSVNYGVSKDKYLAFARLALFDLNGKVITELSPFIANPGLQQHDWQSITALHKAEVSALIDPEKPTMFLIATRVYLGGTEVGFIAGWVEIALLYHALQPEAISIKPTSAASLDSYAIADNTSILYSQDAESLNDQDMLTLRKTGSKLVITEKTINNEHVQVLLITAAIRHTELQLVQAIALHNVYNVHEPRQFLLFFGFSACTILLITFFAIRQFNTASHLTTKLQKIAEKRISEAEEKEILQTRLQFSLSVPILPFWKKRRETSLPA